MVLKYNLAIKSNQILPRRDAVPSGKASVSNETEQQGSNPSNKVYTVIAHYLTHSILFVDRSYSHNQRTFQIFALIQKNMRYLFNDIIRKI